jgi:hypothetical protein
VAAICWLFVDSRRVIVYPDLQPKDLEPLISFHLDDEVGKLFRSLKQNLMWNLGGNANHISCGELLAESTLNLAIPLFMRLDRFSSNHRAAHKQGSSSRLDDEDVGLGFMPLDNAVCLTVGEHEKIVGEVSEPASRDVMGAASSFGPELLCHLSQGSGGPVLESFGRRWLCGCEQERENQNTAEFENHEITSGVEM